MKAIKFLDPLVKIVRTLPKHLLRLFALGDFYLQLSHLLFQLGNNPLVVFGKVERWLKRGNLIRN
ncbi:hypothetical protein ES708_17873 [subsurface metagenome]